MTRLETLESFTKSIQSFRSAYLEFHQSLEQVGWSLTFRMQLDQTIKEIIKDFVEAEPSEFLSGLRRSIQMGQAICRAIFLEDTRLVVLEDLLRRLIRNLASHASLSIRQKLWVFLNGTDDIPESRLVFSAQNPTSESTSQLWEFFGKEWPVVFTECPFYPTFWSEWQKKAEKLSLKNYPRWKVARRHLARLEFTRRPHQDSRTLQPLWIPRTQ